MPSTPPVIYTPPSAGSPPDAPGVVYTPPSAGSPPDAPGVVYTPPSAGSPPDAPGAVFATAEDTIPHKLVITGITDPVDSDPLILERGEDSNGYPQWSDGTFSLSWGSGAWNLFSGVVYNAVVNPSTASTPVGLTGWIVDVGTGQPGVAVYQWPASPPAITT